MANQQLALALAQFTAHEQATSIFDRKVRVREAVFGIVYVMTAEFISLLIMFTMFIAAA